MAERVEESDQSSLEAIEAALSLARISKANISSVIQPIYFDTQEPEDLYLMQMKPELCDALLEGEHFVIRGEPGDSAVLCTKSKTFEIKEAETSNSLLLAPTLLVPDGDATGEEISQETITSQKVIKTMQTYYELKPCIPRLTKLHHFLKRCPFLGKEYEEKEVKDKYTLEDLKNHIQASDDELSAAIQRMHACEIDGYIRLLDFYYKFRVVTSLLETIDAQSHPLDKIPKKEIIDLLEDLEPREVLEQCFSWYANETSELDEDGCFLWAIKEDEVCKMFGVLLLKESFRFNYHQFMESWQDSVPAGMKTSLEQLKGLAVADLNKRPEVIFLFPSFDLPENLLERLNKLFETKPKWSESEILPYIRDVAMSENEAKALLTKHTRCFVSGGVRMYSSKW